MDIKEPVTFSIKSNAVPEWQLGLTNNTDPYGRRVYTYAADWAAGMEKRIAGGESLKDVYKEEAHKADTDGITGFMYGAAVHVLAKVWEHGDDLRRLHNAEYGIKEDIKGTVNPAIIRVKV